MFNRKTLGFCVLIVAASSFAGQVWADQFSSVINEKVNKATVTNKYGFSSWNIENSSCARISKSQSSSFKACVSQKNIPYFKKRYLQYRCKTRQGVELVIYRTQRICRKIHAAMYIESF